MPDPFSRMHDRVMNRLGNPSTINAQVTAWPVVIEQGVAMTGEYGEVVAFRSVAVVPSINLPKSGDALVVDGAAYVIDSLLENNGYVVRCVLR